MPHAVLPPRHLLRSAILGAALLLAGRRSALGQDAGRGAGAILGRWSGTSTCVKADWNAACNDEVIIYDFVPADSGRIMLHAQKVVDGKPEPMGDLELTYDPSTRQWSGNFDNARVSIRWIYEVSGSRLTGRVVDRRSLRVGRNVVAAR